MTTYSECKIEKTETTTSTPGTGRIASVYRITGRITKPEGKRPFLTSVKTCREFIDECDEFGVANVNI